MENRNMYPSKHRAEEFQESMEIQTPETTIASVDVHVHESPRDIRLNLQFDSNAPYRNDQE